MKTYYLAFSAILAASLSSLCVRAEEPAAAPPAPASEHHGPGHFNPEERVKMLKEKLGLSDDQSAKLLAIFQQDADKLKGLHEDKALSQEDRRSKGREIMQASTESVKAVLTPEQQAKWKEEMDKRREHHNGGPEPAAAAK